MPVCWKGWRGFDQFVVSSGNQHGMLTNGSIETNIVDRTSVSRSVKSANGHLDCAPVRKYQISGQREFTHFARSAAAIDYAEEVNIYERDLRPIKSTDVLGTIPSHDTMVDQTCLPGGVIPRVPRELVRPTKLHQMVRKPLLCKEGRWDLRFPL